MVIVEADIGQALGPAAGTQLVGFAVLAHQLGHQGFPVSLPETVNRGTALGQGLPGDAVLGEFLAEHHVEIGQVIALEGILVLLSGHVVPPGEAGGGGFSLLTLILIVASANRVFSGDLVLLSRKKAMKNSIEDLNRNLKDVFHSEKNLMFSMMILADEARSAYGTPEGLEKLDRLTEIAKDRMEMITSSLNRIRELHLHATPTDMRTLVSQALDTLALPEGIRCERHFCDEPVRCMVDEYHTRNALKNIFVNAVDALQLCKREDKVISVTVNASRAWVSLSIRDNGPGIPKQELRRVMMPFVSTKSKTSNWGIGLPYAFRVVNAQLGQMRIQSSDQEDKSYTQVDILLPRERNEAQ